MEEVPELVGAEGAVTACVREAFRALRDTRNMPSLSRPLDRSGEEGRAGGRRVTMAVAGVDLLVARRQPPLCSEKAIDSEKKKEKVTGVGEFEAFIVEVNNNPAMPDEKKTMSRKYREHLFTLVSSIITLGIHTSNSSLDTETDTRINRHLLSNFNRL
jgi:hypothetical protein